MGGGRGAYSATCISRRRRSCHILNLVLHSRSLNSLHSEAAAVVVAEAALSPSRLPGDGELRTLAPLTSETIENARRSNHYQLQEQAEGGLF